MKKLILLITILLSTTVFGQRLLFPSLTTTAGIQTKQSETIQSISFTTNSISATYTPTSIVNTGTDLTWEATGAVSEGPYVLSGNNVPTFDLSGSGAGITTITISSSSAFGGVTKLLLDNMEVASANVDLATGLKQLSVKLTTALTGMDISKLIDLNHLTFRSNTNMTSLDISANTKLDSLYLYDMGLTSLDITNNPKIKLLLIYGNALTDTAIDNLLLNLDAPINGPPLSNGTLNYSNQTGGGIPTSASYDAYNSLVGKGWTITGTAPPTPTPDPPSSSIAGLPIISNFHVKNGEPTKVYFDTNETITASNATGFTISGQTISNITIIGATQTGHYFTISPGVTFWDNNTIRYEGGSNIQDTETNGVADFTLTYIRNEIIEPTNSGTVIYAWADATGANNGTSEANAYTDFKTAISALATGGTLYVKASRFVTTDHGDFYASGTVNNPIKIIGYKTTPGDIISNYYTYTPGSLAPELDATEMPIIDGNDLAKYGLWIAGDYVIVKNFQIEQYSRGINGGVGAENIVIDNCNSKDAYGAGASEGTPLNLGSLNGGTNYTTPTNLRVINSNLINGGNSGIQIYGVGNLVKNCNIYGDNKYGTGSIYGADYPILLAGSSNIVKDVNIQFQDGTINTASHGMSFRGGDFDSSDFRSPMEYNLVDNIYVKTGGSETVQFRNPSCKYNVVKNSEFEGFATSGSVGNNDGLQIQTGADYNIFENNYVHGMRTGINFTMGTEGDETVTEDMTTSYNIIRNNIFENLVSVIGFQINSVAEGINTYWNNNEIQNCTLYNADSMIRSDEVAPLNAIFTGSKFVNCIIQDVTTDNYDSDLPQLLTMWDFEYCNIWNSWTTSIGTNSINENPNFVDYIGFSPTNILLKVPNPLTDVVYDYNKLERDAINPTIGAVESPVISVAGAPVLSNYSIELGFPTRVYFESNESISATLASGFTVSGKGEPTNITINSNALTGHYFTFSSPFTSGDTPTIEYSGTGSNLIDVAESLALASFTATAITNNL